MNLVFLKDNVLFCQLHKKEPKKVTATDKFVKIIEKPVFQRNTSRLDDISIVLINYCISRLSVAYQIRPTHAFLDF